MKFFYHSFAFVSLVTATCYLPDGTVNPDAYPVNNSTENSACCQADQEGFTNGLCKSPPDAKINWFWRVGCTDKTFKDPSCPQVCEQYGDEEWVTNQCDATTFCCALKAQPGDPVWVASNYTCCSNSAATFQLPEPEHLSGPNVYKAGLWLVENPAFFNTPTPSATPAPTSDAASAAVTEVFTTVPSVNGANPSSTPSITILGVNPTANAANAASSSAPPAVKSSSSNAAAIGAGVGIPLGIALLAGMGFLFWRHHKKNYQRRDSPESGMPTDSMAPPMAAAHGNAKPYNPYQQPPAPPAQQQQQYPPVQNGYYAPSQDQKPVAMVQAYQQPVQTHQQPVYEMHASQQYHEMDGGHKR